MLIMGWDGTEVTPQIKSLIEDHHLGSIILTAKNLKSSFALKVLHLSHTILRASSFALGAGQRVFLAA